jgi:DNA-binding transcriptional MerR regulator
VTIKEVGARTGLSVHTLRYYERLGLVAPVGRRRNGHRAYSEDDVYRIRFVMRLRAAGMPIARIRRYAELAARGDATIQERLELLEAHRGAVEQQIGELTEHLAVITAEVAHYRQLHEPQLAASRA